MKTILLALALIVVCTEVKAGVLDDVYYFLYPNRRPVVVEPSSGPKREVSPRQAPEPAAAPKPRASAPTEARKPRSATAPERAKSAPKPPSKPPGWVCTQIGFGLNTIGRAGVIAEGTKRGYSKSTTEKAIRDCGY